MTKEQKTSELVRKDKTESTEANAFGILLIDCLTQSPAKYVGLRDEEIEALAALGKTVTAPLLQSLFEQCADIYAIRDHMRALLEDERYGECHQVLLLLYAACREPAPMSAALIACHEELLVPYIWGVMHGLNGYLQAQDELYKEEANAPGRS